MIKRKNNAICRMYNFRVDLKKLDFGEGAGEKVLRADEGQIYAGETSTLFIPARPFKFQEI